MRPFCFFTGGEIVISAGNKGARLLDLYDRFNKGAILTKAELAKLYKVGEKTIQRDIDDLRAYLSESSMYSGNVSIDYDPKRRGYVLVHSQYEHLNNQEVLGIAKVLLESRAFKSEEMKSMLEKLLAESSPESKDMVEDMVKNEAFLYVPPHHGKKLLPILWDLSGYIRGKQVITLSYTRKDGVATERTVKPVAVLFSEYYFYLIAFLADDSKPYPTIFRVDRIRSAKPTGDTFRIPYSERFSEGEFRKRVQFMYSGPLHTVKFRYRGPSIEAVLDRLPTAEVLGEKEGVYTVQVEVYGKGIDMWLASQGDKVEVLSSNIG